MKLLYIADIRFPMERANGIQTIETCHALARRGIDVEVVVRRSDARSDAECLAFFDLSPNPNLHLRRVRAPGRLGFLARTFGVLTGEWDVVYTRDLLIADLARRTARAPVVYEAHTVTRVFAEERSGMYADAADRNRPSASKLARLDRRERGVCRNVSGLVTITSALLESLEQRHGPLAPSLVAPDGDAGCRRPCLPGPSLRAANGCTTLASSTPGRVSTFWCGRCSRSTTPSSSSWEASRPSRISIGSGDWQTSFPSPTASCAKTRPF